MSEGGCEISALLFYWDVAVLIMRYVSSLFFAATKMDNEKTILR
ncbi:hypothetical protein AB9M62_31890 [Bacillales bacterium AN1005]